MIWDFGMLLRPLRRSRPATRGQVLRGAMRNAATGSSPEEERVDLADLYGPGAESPNMLRRGSGLVLRDGMPYDLSGADENDWRL